MRDAQDGADIAHGNICCSEVASEVRRPCDCIPLEFGGTPALVGASADSSGDVSHLTDRLERERHGHLLEGDVLGSRNVLTSHLGRFAEPTRLMITPA
jgi:hypothetical protein